MSLGRLVVTADITHWAFEDGTDVEILNALDDYSRLLVANDVPGHHPSSRRGDLNP